VGDFSWGGGSPWCKKRGPPGKIACNSSGQDIDFPTTAVKYSPQPLRRMHKHLKLNTYFDVEKAKSLTFSLCQNRMSQGR
jgi:hypothetical protein